MRQCACTYRDKENKKGKLEVDMEKQIIKCSECEYCEGIRPFGNTRSRFTCEHPDREYIREYYRQHKINKLKGFIGFGEKWSDIVPIKTSPNWCPRKKV